ncbi:class I SAM-dependent methyltransferase [Gilvimarinus agarilyticus]|uniref:methyltransferase domain-containing protein n=1 Tax=Gilvimarinus sp. 2_MG-2023 TaxID=3062666 RepID=UPI001C0905FC|nr:methyltransferase domain-containing protein [Gilvimarinus sp. 2_MG-2023]MBU2887076.1 class I SAM-dependent methyltransferase [Gilvimarinus agarilyticus]MDO6571735.1 methyltransferase domain-containing protein [Gilvimarinus sp. 2_MG-2023]
MVAKRRSPNGVGLEEQAQEVSRWFAQPRGQALLQRERGDIDEALGCLFGYHLCQISACQELTLTDNSRITHTFALQGGAGRSSSTTNAGAYSEYHRLPLAPESVDVILLHHVLDFSQSPHQVLAETSRALIPRGHIIIVGFNPWSLGGAWRLFKRTTSRKLLWRQQALRVGRLYDWFALLDLEVINIKRGHFWPFSQDPSASTMVNKLEKLLRLGKAPWGDYYLITVRKDVSGVIPLKPEWQAPKLVDLAGVSGKLGGRQVSRDHNDSSIRNNKTL